MKKKIYKFVCFVFYPFFAALLFFYGIGVRFLSSRKCQRARIVWGPTPIISNMYWARAMKDVGYVSETYMEGYYSVINKKSDYNFLLESRFGSIPNFIKYYIAFFESLLKYDVFVLPFEGFYLGRTPYWRLESWALSLSGKKTVLIPYGADAYVYRRIKSISLTHGLLMSYPGAARIQSNIQKRVDYWISRASCVICGVMAADGFGRWDVITPSPFVIDISVWRPSIRKSDADGVSGAVYIAHAPNHRGFKGTEFILDAVKKLKEEGLNVELVLIEKKKNEEVRNIFYKDVDILVDQLIASGYAFNAIEGMASGLPVVANFEDDSYVIPTRRWSFLGECPIVSASPESVVDVLRKLVTNPQLRQDLGGAGRSYAEKYHGYDSAQYLFSAVIDYLYGRRDSLINLYHPLLGEYKKDEPKIVPPLVDNKIPDL
ncbi:glycosyltransferase family protein [Micavibrio aeruginosavorus]|nr:glycosyltransferase family 4 protein [Micavibrio aeruginosavorus]